MEKPNYNDPLFQKYLQQAKVIAIGESNSNYNPTQNKDKSGKAVSTALGKYQYLWGTWGNQIISKAKEWGYDIKNENDFINNPIVQEKFFQWDHYNKYQKLKNIVKTSENPLKLNMAEMGFLMHWYGEKGAEEVINEGKVKKATYSKDGTLTNPDTLTYLKKFRNNLKNNGLYEKPEESIVPHINDTEARMAYNKFNKEIEEINKRRGKDSDDILNMEVAAVQSKYESKGYLPHFNAYIESENEFTLKETEKARQELVDLNHLLNNSVVFYKSDSKSNQQKILHKNKADITGDLDSEVIKRIKKINPNILKTKKEKLGLDEISYENLDLEELEKTFNSKYEALTGKKYSLFDKDENGNIIRKKEQSIDVLKDRNPMGLLASKINPNIMDKEVFQGIFKNPFDRNVPGKKLKPLLEKTLVETNLPEPEVEEIKEPELSTNDPYKYTEEDLKKIIEFERKQIESKPVEPEITGIFDFKKQENQEFAQADKQPEFPFEEILSGALGVAMGLNLAKEKIPMRDEMVSEMFMDYTSKLKRLSEIGLSPEEEAYAKKNLNESYNSSLEMVTRASSGNRNIVLGNLGRIDAQKQNNLLQLALMENNAKMENFYKYGEAVKYINEFDSRRDIVNNERKYNETLMNREAGGQLMAAGFKSIMDGINYYKDNKIGSPKQLYQSKMYRELYNIDPFIKDNGLADTPFTPSFEKKRIEKNNEIAKKFNEYREVFNTLPKDKKVVISEFLNNNNNLEDVYGMMDFLKENDVTGKLNYDKFYEAKKENDYSKMFEASKNLAGQSGNTSIEESIQNSETISLTEEQLKNDSPIVEKQTVTPAANAWNGNFKTNEETSESPLLNIDLEENKPKKLTEMTQEERIINNFETTKKKWEEVNRKFDEYQVNNTNKELDKMILEAENFKIN